MKEKLGTILVVRGDYEGRPRRGDPASLNIQGRSCLGLSSVDASAGRRPTCHNRKTALQWTR